MTNRLTLSAASLAEIHALPGDALLKTDEAAAFLCISPNSLAWYRARRMGPNYIKIGSRAIRYRVSALRDYATSVRSEVGPMKAEG